MLTKTNTLWETNLDRDHDKDLKTYFCNIRTWKILMDESFEEFYSIFLDENNEFNYKLFQKIIGQVNSLLANGSMNIRYESLETYIWFHSSSVKEILSDETELTKNLMKLKDDLLLFSNEIFKIWWEIENKESIKKLLEAKDKDYIKTRIKYFIEMEKSKIEKIKFDYIKDKIDLAINTFTEKFFELI